MNAVGLNQCRFLVVDDVRLCRVNVVAILKKLECKSYQVAENGAEAIAVLRDPHSEIDCIISDISMPNMNGLELLKAIRCGDYDLPRDMTVGLLTGHGESHLVHAAIRLDVNAFILKPVTPESLETHIHRLLQIRASEAKWLKQAEEYKKIDVDENLNDTFDPHCDKSQVAVIQEEDTDAAEKFIKVDEEGNVRYNLEEIPENAVLAKEILGKTGKLLFPAGTVLSKMNIWKLQDLVELGLDVKEIWVKPES